MPAVLRADYSRHPDYYDEAGDDVTGRAGRVLALSTPWWPGWCWRFS